ncbi:hypothetical protein GCM10023093_00330 [Nemorincola caseinilytica]|uniref:Cyclase n=1 Tax=Nemorincola caseinilytica TaxID=2054315 RepID=A0ABP8N3E0_9BACT
MATTLIVSIKVEDMAKWKMAFDEAVPMREKLGIKVTGIYQSADDANSISLISEYPSLEMAKAVVASPEWEAAQKRAGVIGGFDIKYFNKIA